MQIHNAVPAQLIFHKRVKEARARMAAHAIRPAQLPAPPTPSSEQRPATPSASPIPARLMEWLSHSDRAPSLDLLFAVVSAETGVSVADIRSIRRNQASVNARHIFMWLATNLTSGSLVAIGRRIGGRDHSTILHGSRKMTALAERNGVSIDKANLSETVAAMVRALRGGTP